MKMYNDMEKVIKKITIEYNSGLIVEREKEKAISENSAAALVSGTSRALVLNGDHITAITYTTIDGAKIKRDPGYYNRRIIKTSLYTW